MSFVDVEHILKYQQLYIQTNGKVGHSPLFHFMHKGEITATICQLIKNTLCQQSRKYLNSPESINYTVLHFAFLVLLILFPFRTR